MLQNKIKTFTKVQKSVKINILFRNMETESLHISNAVVDYNVRQEPNYMEESEQIMKYIFNGINENVKFSEIASDSVPTLGYIIDPRSFAYAVEYLREQVSKQGIEETIMFNNLITNTDDLGLYESTGDAVVLKSNYKDVYNDYISNIVFNKSETNDISEKDTTNNTEETASDMGSDTSEQEVDIEILNYITRSIETETPLSCIIKESYNLGYSMSSTKFFNAMDVLIKNDTALMVNYLRKYDDEDWYFISSENKIYKLSITDKEYSEILRQSNSNHSLLSNKDTVSGSDTDSARYILPVDADSNSNVSNSGISFEHDSNLKDNKTILILTVITFLAINALAWWDRNYNRDVNTNDQANEDTLNSANEEMLNLTTLTTTLLICLIPSFISLLFSLRYYYYYKYFYKFK